MVYYKSRYTKRRGTTRTRKRTYRSRYTPRRTSYGRRRYVYNKANKAEWKQTPPATSLDSLDVQASSIGTYHTINPAFNSMAVGADPGQRIGRRLNANFVKIRWQADLIDTGDIDSMNIRFVVIQIKGDAFASPTTSPHRVDDLFPGLSLGPALPSWRMASISPFRDGITNTCRILFDRTYKLNANSSTSQVVFRRKIRMQPLKWEMKNDLTYNTQASNPVFFYWIAAQHTTVNNDQTYPLNVIYRLVYTDS